MSVFKAWVLQKWMSLPTWFRKTLVECIEMGAIALGVYLYSSKVGGQPMSLDMAEIVVLKAMAKVVRSHPEIPVADYVNNQKD